MATVRHIQGGFTEEIQADNVHVAAVSHTQEEVHLGDPESRRHSSSSQAKVHPADTVAAVRNTQGGFTDDIKSQADIVATPIRSGTHKRGYTEETQSHVTEEI